MPRVKEATPRPMGILSSAVMFRAFSCLLWLAGGSMGPRGVAAEWDYVVPIPLEFWLVRYAAPAADRIVVAVDRAAATKHTSVGIVIHARFNAAGFIAAISGRADL